ncbi:MAG: hypothetical protein INQ03_12470 [Candidatus Heimdallarchaeota archaeon]|nr:hypothetical protein [Candidatus Heimdallarchaeota archaeon]
MRIGIKRLWLGMLVISYSVLIPFFILVELIKLGVLNPEKVDLTFIDIYFREIFLLMTPSLLHLIKLRFRQSYRESRPSNDSLVNTQIQETSTIQEQLEKIRLENEARLQAIREKSEERRRMKKQYEYNSDLKVTTGKSTHQSSISSKLLEIFIHSTKQCIICYQSNENEKGIITECCGSFFHISHIKLWIAIKSNCPHCKQIIPIKQRSFINYGEESPFIFYKTKHKRFQITRDAP